MTYGCIGEKLSHSFSKEIHRLLADYSYELLELQPDQVGPFMQQKEFQAINVTIPYKKTVIPHLDWISPQAKAIGAVNTIVHKDGVLKGYNTDFFGMRALIYRLEIDFKGRKVLILGSGGTAQTAYAVASSLGAAEILIVSRGGAKGISYEQAYAEHSDAQIIINTTPCGMFPSIYAAPLDLSSFEKVEGVIDAVYNPLRSELVMQAQARGIPALGGLYMLVAQAAYAVELFLDIKLPQEKIEQVYQKIKADKENVVLIGMPGCGKTTVGRLLSEKLHRPFMDTDELIFESCGRRPGEIIQEDGEEAFRQIEAKIVRDAVAAQNGCIVASGGGLVLRDENIWNLKRNGRLFFLDRPFEDLAITSDRPLSNSKERLTQIYDARYPRYCKVADSIISPADNAERSCKIIIEEMEK